MRPFYGIGIIALGAWCGLMSTTGILAMGRDVWFALAFGMVPAAVLASIALALLMEHRP